MFDNAYVVDKLVQATVLAVVYYILIDRELTHLMILFGASFLVMIMLDALQGKTGYTSIPISTLVKVTNRGHSTLMDRAASFVNTNTNGNDNGNGDVNGDGNGSGSQKKVSKSSPNLNLNEGSGGAGDQTRICNSAPIRLSCHDPGPEFLCVQRGPCLDKYTGVGGNGLVESMVVEKMDDAVARTYYASGKLPDQIDEKGLFGQQLEMSECCEEYASNEGTNLSQLSTEKTLFDTYYQAEQHLEGLRKKRDNLSKKVYRDADGGAFTRQSASEKTAPWEFGTFNFTMDGTGKHHFRAFPYCLDQGPEDRCIKPDPILGDPLANDLICVPCDMKELSSELTRPLKDRILREGPYRECREVLTRQTSTDRLEPVVKKVAQSSYVPEYSGGPCRPCL